MDEIYYKLIQDDDCHWYVIPAELEEKFQEWVDLSVFGTKQISLWERLADLEEKYDFNQYRVDGPHRIVFKNWSEI